MANEKRPHNKVQSVKTMFSIIEQLESQEVYGVTDLAQTLEMPKSTVHKHLQTLEEEGYVRAQNGRYELGLKFLKHGGTVRDRNRVYTFGRPKVESLGEQLDEMVILSVKEGSDGVFLFRANDRYNLKQSLPLGARFPLHLNAAGKAMLAELDERVARDLLEDTELPRATDSTITDIDTMLNELQMVRGRGYALNRGERDPSVRAVSAAIRDEKTGRIGAISISIPSDSPAVKHLDDEYAEAVREAASELSLQLKNN